LGSKLALIQFVGGIAVIVYAQVDFYITRYNTMLDDLLLSIIGIGFMILALEGQAYYNLENSIRYMKPGTIIISAFKIRHKPELVSIPEDFL
jgi:hypothetical protein